MVGIEGRLGESSRRGLLTTRELRRGRARTMSVMMLCGVTTDKEE